MDIMRAVQTAEEVFWSNPEAGSELNYESQFSDADIDDAEQRLIRFAPLIMHCFPETEQANGIIESPFTEINAMRCALEDMRDCTIPGRLFLKQDNALPISGSVKARGGIYEVLKHTEELALEAGLLEGIDDDILKLTTPEAKAFFAKHKVQVGSTGNLGLSIGIMSAALGYDAIVHMSADAKQWKKDLLRKKGARVVEYSGDYGEAVRCGRALSDADPDSYFVDDENSRALFCGYAVAGRRLARQLSDAGIVIDEKHPLLVYIPCGVGGAPGGIALGVKRIFGNNAHVFFQEPVQAPCMLIGLMSGKPGEISVQDVGLTGKTQADGLAVGRCSKLAAKEMRTLLSGEMTVDDERLITNLRLLWKTEGIFIEPSACAAFEGAVHCMEAMCEDGIESVKENAVHVVWSTGGNMVPDEVRKELIG